LVHVVEVVSGCGSVFNVNETEDAVEGGVPVGVAAGDVPAAIVLVGDVEAVPHVVGRPCAVGLPDPLAERVILEGVGGCEGRVGAVDAGDEVAAVVLEVGGVAGQDLPLRLVPPAIVSVVGGLDPGGLLNRELVRGVVGVIRVGPVGQEVGPVADLVVVVLVGVEGGALVVLPFRLGEALEAIVLVVPAGAVLAQRC